jgi:uncharacterized protein YaeQ
MSLTATIYNFDIDLADQDRGVYETLALRVARHPSESEEYLWTRTLAYCFEFTEGINFSHGGLSEPDQPAILVRDLTGAIRTWVEIGSPDADRLHKASKVAPRVAVYSHKDPAQIVSRLRAARIHRAEAIEFNSLDRAFIAQLPPHLNRRVAFAVSVVDREVYLAIGSETLTSQITRHSLL